MLRVVPGGLITRLFGHVSHLGNAKIAGGLEYHAYRTPGAIKERLIMFFPYFLPFYPLRPQKEKIRWRTVRKGSLSADRSQVHELVDGSR